MKDELLKQLIEKTFAKIACPLQGNGVYSEIQNAILEAYSIGKVGEPIEENSVSWLAQ